MNWALGFPGCSYIALGYGDFTELFSFRASFWAFSGVSYIWPCNLVFKHGIKAGGRWRIMAV